MRIIIDLAENLLQLYSWMIFACIILRYFPEFQRNKFARTLSNIVDPFLAIFRKYIPSIGGIDLSPLVAILLLNLASQGLSNW